MPDLSNDRIQLILEEYVAMWNEPDALRRRATIEKLFAREGVQFTKSLEARGHAALEQRVANAHSKWVAGEGCRFRFGGNVDAHHNVVKFNWEMVSPQGEVDSLGLDILILDEEYRIQTIYQFIL